MNKLILVLLFLLIPLLSNNYIVKTEIDIPVQPNIENVYELILKHNLSHPEIVLAQSILETGWYKSDLCLQKNNLFGLYNSRKMEYFQFDHWEESIIGYKEMVQYKHRPGEDYYIFLERINYAESKDYNKTIKKILRHVKDFKKAQNDRRGDANQSQSEKS